MTQPDPASQPTPVGVLVSGRGSNLQAVLDAAGAPDAPFRVAIVLCNRRDAAALDKARHAGVPALWIPHRGKDRAAFDAELVGALRAHGASWVVCAGFMRVLTPVLLDAFPGRVLNIHPSLLPAFPGLKGPAQALAHGARVAGCTVHLVTPGVDAGPIVAQGACPVRPDDTEATLAARILQLEHRLLPMAVRWAAQGRLTVEHGRVRVDLPPGQSPSLWTD